MFRSLVRWNLQSLANNKKINENLTTLVTITRQSSKKWRVFRVPTLVNWCWVSPIFCLSALKTWLQSLSVPLFSLPSVLHTPFLIPGNPHYCQSWLCHQLQLAICLNALFLFSGWQTMEYLFGWLYPQIVLPAGLWKGMRWRLWNHSAPILSGLRIGAKLTSPASHRFQLRPWRGTRRPSLALWKVQIKRKYKK